MNRFEWLIRTNKGNFTIIGICAVIVAIVATISSTATRHPATPTSGAQNRPPSGVQRSTVPPHAGTRDTAISYTLASLRTKILTPQQVGDKFKVRDLSHLQGPFYDPHAFDSLKNPRNIPACYARPLTLDTGAHIARALYYRPLDGASDNYVERTYFVIIATYNRRAALAADYAKLRNSHCAPTYSTLQTRVPSNLPRDQWYFRPPSRQTWQQFTELYKGWTDTHALHSVSVPRWVGAWQQHQYLVYDYLTRGNALIVTVYGQATPNADSRPITHTAERLLTAFVSRLG